jgi:hypothetical protein
MQKFLALPILCLLLVQGLSANRQAKTYRFAENNVIVHFGEKPDESVAREIVAIAANARQQLAEKYHLALPAPVEIRLSPTTYEFCRMTGQPWWQASIYRRPVIYLQPVRVLRGRGILETTLRHELLHQLIDEHSKGNSPTWLSEALAIYNSGEIAFLKPARKKAEHDELKWNQLERRSEKTTNQADAERLYFQLYHLGQFLETEFSPKQIAAVLIQLGEKTPFTQACQDLWGASVNELEQRWLLHWAEVAE